MKKIFILLFFLILLSACKVKAKPSLSLKESQLIIGIDEEVLLEPIITNYQGGFSITFSEAGIVSANNLTLKGVSEGRVMVILSLTDEATIKTYLFITVVNSDIPYSITYVLNGGSININSPTSYKVSQTPFLLPIPQKQAYNFLGWYTKSDFSSTSLSSIPKNTKGDLVLYAKWG